MIPIDTCYTAISFYVKKPLDGGCVSDRGTRRSASKPQRIYYDLLEDPTQQKQNSTPPDTIRHSTPEEDVLRPRNIWKSMINYRQEIRAVNESINYLVQQYEISYNLFFFQEGAAPEKSEDNQQVRQGIDSQVAPQLAL
ncbi:hypothetical protein J6590_037401 [Homalodisca vitripennis]|nr:hypothetical protein J6590_037401 [Homalodisca vitripennis]